MDYNYLKHNSFQFSLERIPETTFRVVEVNLPEISVPAANAPSGTSMQWFPGCSSEYSQLTIKFIVDEHMKNYEELWRWITQQRFDSVSTKDFIPRNMTENKLTSDASLHITDNASNTNRIIRFLDVFPISVGSIDFDTSNSDPVTCSATFYISRFIFEK